MSYIGPRQLARLRESNAVETNKWLAAERRGAALLDALKVAQVRIFMLEGSSEAYEACRVAIAAAEGEK